MSEFDPHEIIPENGLCRQPENEIIFGSLRSLSQKPLELWVEAADLCQECPVNDDCEAAVDAALPGPQAFIVGGRLVEITVKSRPISPESLESPEDPDEGNAAVTLQKARLLMQEQGIAVPKQLKEATDQWRAWLEAEFQDFAAQHTISLADFSKTTAFLLGQYLSHTRAYPTLPTKEFVTSFGELLAADAKAFSEASISRPHYVAAGNSIAHYQEVLAAHAENPYLSRSDVKRAFSMAPRNPEKYLAQYQARVRFCYEELLPQLQQKYGYEGKMPSLHMVREICRITPSTAATKVQVLFESSLFLGQVLKEEPSLFFAEKRLLGQSLEETIEKIEDATPKLVWAEIQPDNVTYAHLTTLREANRAQLLPPSTRGHLLERRLLERAVKIAMQDQEIAFTNSDLRTAATFAFRATHYYNNLPEEKRRAQLPADPQQLAKVILTYLFDVRAMRQNGLYKAEAVAKYHGRNARELLAAKYPNFDRETLNFCLRVQPSQPHVLAEEITQGYQTIATYVEGRPNFSLEPVSMLRIATRYRSKAMAMLPKLEKEIHQQKIYWQDSDDVEPWMVELAVIASPGQVNKAVLYFRSKFRSYTESLDRQRDNASRNSSFSLHDLIESDLAQPEEETVTTEEMQEQRFQIRELLSALTLIEQLAVAHVFDLQFKGVKRPTEHELKTALGVTGSLHTHVLQEIIPRIRAQTK